MPTVEEFLGELFHIYDAEKAHDYYLRTRELKGRQSATVETPVAKTTGVVKTTVKKPGSPMKAQPVKMTPEQRRAQISAQVEALRAKLAQLKEVLAQLVQEAKVRSGVEPEPVAAPTTKPTPGTSDRKLTPEQKADAAQRAKEWREANPDKAMDQEAAKLDKQIQNIQDKINQMREKLKTVIADPFQTTGSVGAGSNTPMRKDRDSQNGS